MRWWGNWVRWNAAGDDRIEQAWSHPAVGHRLNVAAGLRELRVATPVECEALAADTLRPNSELVGRQRLDLELHSGEAVAAEVRGQPLIDALPVRLKIQPGRHPRHGVD